MAWPCVRFAALLGFAGLTDGGVPAPQPAYHSSFGCLGSSGFSRVLSELFSLLRGFLRGFEQSRLSDSMNCIQSALWLRGKRLVAQVCRSGSH